jgi:hypothetical protein
MDSRLRGNDSVEMWVFITFDRCNNKIVRHVLFALPGCSSFLLRDDACFKTGFDAKLPWAIAPLVVHRLNRHCEARFCGEAIWVSTVPKNEIASLSVDRLAMTKISAIIFIRPTHGG